MKPGGLVVQSLNTSNGQPFVFKHLLLADVRVGDQLLDKVI